MQFPPLRGRRRAELRRHAVGHGELRPRAAPTVPSCQRLQQRVLVSRLPHPQERDLQLRGVCHQEPERVRAHLLVCFLAYVLWETLGLLAKAAGLGDDPRRICDGLAQIMLVDVVVRTRSAVEIRKRSVAQPTPL